MSAFSPPRYTISNEILTNIGRIAAAKEVIDNAPLIPNYQRQFKKEAIARTVHFATALEGNPLNLTEVKRIIEGLPEGKIPDLRSSDPGSVSIVARERDVQEVINYREAIEYMDRLAQKSTKKINVEIISEMNRLITQKIVAEGNGGKFREVGAYSRNSLTWEKSLDWPDPKEVPWLMGELGSWIEAGETDGLNPIIRAGILHTWLVLIHPFEEGNGRTARAVSTLSLSLDGYNVKNLFSLEEYYDREATAYYAGIRSVLDTQADYTLWLTYFSEGLAIEYHRVKERVVKLSREFRTKSAVGQISISERQERLIEFLQDFGKLDNGDFPRLFPNLSEDTVLRELRDLIEKGVLVKKGKTKAARYELK